MAKKLRTVLSLFDGMSCGQIALKELGIEFDAYYASEIDKNAIANAQLNFPNTIQLGDVERWREWDIDWSKVDLILAGSPCQGFSTQGSCRAFNDPRSRLYWAFSDVLKHTIKHNPNCKYLLENVALPSKYETIINYDLGCIPKRINSSCVSAQNRTRLYWSNIRSKYDTTIFLNRFDIPVPTDRHIKLKDIEDAANVDSSLYTQKFNGYRERQIGDHLMIDFPFVSEGYVGLPDGKVQTLRTVCASNFFYKDSKGIRRYTITELRRMQTIPDWVSFGQLSRSNIGKLIGNGWTVDVIKHILSYL